jgi:hypothetical protein
MTECSGPDLPASSVDSCLERVRIQEETNPSPGLESLEASLEARATAGHEPASRASAASTAVEVRPYAPGHSPAAAKDNGDDGAYNTYEDGAATAAPRVLQQTEEQPASPTEDAAAGNTGQERAAVPEDRAEPDGDADAERPPPEIDPEDVPPIADPPDSDAAPRPDDDGMPPADPG